MKNRRIHVIIKERHQDDAATSFTSLEAAQNHARDIIVPQIAEAIEQMSMQPDPRPFMAEVREMTDILSGLFSHDNDLVESAIRSWAKAAHDNYGDMWVEWSD